MSLWIVELANDYTHVILLVQAEDEKSAMEKAKLRFLDEIEWTEEELNDEESSVDIMEVPDKLYDYDTYLVYKN